MPIYLAQFDWDTSWPASATLTTAAKGLTIRLGVRMT